VLIETVPTTGPGAFAPILYAFDSTGTPLGLTALTDVGTAFAFPIKAGWLLETRTGSGGTRITRYSSTLTLDRQLMEGGSPFADTLLPPPGGAGVVAAAVSLDAGSPTCPANQPRQLVLTRFDGTGAEVASRMIGCATQVAAVSVGENGASDLLTLAMGVASHLAPDGGLTQMAQARQGLLQPLIDGRFALNEGTSWTRTLDVNGNDTPPPCWLQVRPDVSRFQIVLGGRAYLAYHDALVAPMSSQACDQYAELVLADGTSCGFVSLSGTDECSASTVAVGLDGTLATLDPRTCTASFWPQVLH